MNIGKVIIFYALFALVSSAFGYANATETYEFNIEEQALGDALIQLSKNVNKPFFLRSSLVKGKTAPSIKGSYTVQAALDKLLDNTGLTGELTPKGQIRVKKIKGYSNSDFEPLLALGPPDIEEVVVSGIRYSWQSSAALKRNALRFKDVLSEADMNKLPDGNITDSLQRINGLQIERRNGDGTRFRIRGFDDNVTLYNGEQFLTGLEYFQLGLGEQGYENSLETVPVELLRRIEVYKSVRASDIEGAVGGTVDLISRNAFDVEDYLITADAKLDYGKFAKKPRPEAFIGLGKNWDDTFAALLTLNVSRRTMHMDLAENYVDRGVDEVFGKAVVNTSSSGDDSFEYLAPEFIRLSDIEQTRTQTGASLNLGWRPNDAAEFQFEWFGIYSELQQRNYDLMLGVLGSGNSDLSFNSDVALPYLESANYRSGEQVFRTVGESFDTNANNFQIRGDFQLSERLAMETRLSNSDSRFTQDLGNADLLTLSSTRFLPVWIGEGVYSAPGIDDISSETGWVQLRSICARCQDQENLRSDMAYNIGRSELARFADGRSVLNRPEDTFGAFSQAKGAITDQDAWSLRTDFTWQITDNEENNIVFGFRYDQRESQFSQYRYLTDFSRTAGAARPTQFGPNGEVVQDTQFSPDRAPDANNIGIKLPTFYDICGNGGLYFDEECDIGYGFNENLPYGPWVYQIDPSRQLDYLSFQGRNVINFDLYGTEFDEQIPGFLPWRSFEQHPEDYVTLNDFYPSGSLSSHRASFVNGSRISKNVGAWIDSVAPDSPSRRFDVPRNSWQVEQQNSAMYAELNLHGETIPFHLNVGMRYIETNLDILRYEIDDGTGISLTPQEWYVSSIGTGWKPNRVNNKYSFLLPAFNAVWEFSENWQVRMAASKTISRPSYSQLAGGDDVLYTLQDFFDEDGVFQYEFLQAFRKRSGNPQLKPAEITQGDIALEFYGESASYLQLAFYYKHIEEQIFQVDSLGPVRDESESGSTEAIITRPENTGNGYVKGIELSAQKTWNSGFGLSGNYSYSDTSTQNRSLTKAKLGLPGVSKNVFNAAGFYENDQFNVQLRYTWRDEFLSPYNSLISVQINPDEPELVNLASIYDDYGQWDARALYFLNDNFTFSLDLLNLTQARQESYLEFEGNRQSTTVWEPRLILGVKMDF